MHKDIELLHDTKADRDEVEDALRDKAGLEHLNGLVSQEEYVPNIKEFEKGMDSIRKRIHDEEIMWQVSDANNNDIFFCKIWLLQHCHFSYSKQLKISKAG